VVPREIIGADFRGALSASHGKVTGILEVTMPRIPKFFMARLPVELQPKTWMYAGLALMIGVVIGWAIFAPSRTSAVARHVGSINEMELRSLEEFQKGVDARKVLDAKLDLFAVEYGKQVKDWETHKAKAVTSSATPPSSATVSK
jgi:hypothetical protein